MKPELKKLLILNAPYLLFVYLFDKIGQAVRLAPGADLSGKVLSLADGFSAAFATPLPSLAPMDLLIGIAGTVLIRLMVYFKGKNAKKYRKGIEYGSARWGNAEDIKPYTDPVFQNNVLLTQTERLTMNSRPKQPKYARNKNILVIGGSGSGKTRFFVKPNLMQMHSSYVVTDPKGTVLVECGKLLQRGGYRIKVLNTINFKKSMRYNPFAYIRSEKDILKLVNTLIANTKGDGEKAGEGFWIKSERLFYCALIGYIWYEAPEEEKNFTTLLEMINASEAREDDPEFQSPVDLILSEISLLADDIGIIDHGALLEEESLAELEQKSSKHIRFTLSDTAQAARILERTFHESHFSIQDDHNLRLHNLDLSVGKIVTAFVENGLEVSEAHTCEESLEDYFKRVTGGEGIA